MCKKGKSWQNPLEMLVCAPNGKLHRNIAILPDGDWFFDRIQLAGE
jgi:hypothetical protein